jgi:hypothetical protein
MRKFQKSKVAARAKPNRAPKSAKRTVPVPKPRPLNATQPERIATSRGGVADMIGLGLSSINALIKRGEFDIVHVGRRTLVMIASVHAFLERQAAKERGQPSRGEPASIARSRRPTATAPAE